MKEFEFKRSQLKIKMYGKEFMIRKPTIAEVEQMESDLRDDEKKGGDVMTGFLVSLGFDAESVKDMEFDHFQELVSYLSGVKKNLEVSPL